MNKILKSVTLICLSLLMLALISCGNDTQEPTYTLTEHQMQLIDKIYSYRNVWEKHNGKSCSNIRFVEKNGYKFLLCTYGATSTGVDFMGQGDAYASTEIKYTISQNGMHEATLKEYGSNDYGIVTGMYSYNANANVNDKKISLAKAITKKNNIAFP